MTFLLRTSVFPWTDWPRSFILLRNMPGTTKHAPIGLSSLGFHHLEESRDENSGRSMCRPILRNEGMIRSRNKYVRKGKPKNSKEERELAIRVRSYVVPFRSDHKGQLGGTLVKQQNLGLAL